MRCAKSCFEFWEKRIRERDNVLVGNGEKKRLTQDSVIIYIGIVDYEKGIIRGGWSAYEDIDSALGYLQHVYLPTAYYTWFERESDQVMIPISPFDVVKSEVIKYMDQRKDEIRRESLGLERGFYYLNHLWDKSKEIKREKIQDFCDDFNNRWDKDPNKRLFVKVMCDCSQIPKELLQENDFVEVIEEELDMPFCQFEDMCKKAYDEPLINRNFISLLNSKLPIWF